MSKNTKEFTRILKGLSIVMIIICIIVAIYFGANSFTNTITVKSIYHPSYEGKTTNQMTPEEFKQWEHDMSKAVDDIKGSPFNNQLGN